MRKLTHSESEIVKSVKELESGVSADEIGRRLCNPPQDSATEQAAFLHRRNPTREVAG